MEEQKKKSALDQEAGPKNPNDPRKNNAPENSNIQEPEDVTEDISKKAPGKDFDRNEEGSDEIERRRAG